MIGNTIVISADPQGKFLEGIVSGTPKPGTVMEVSSYFFAGRRHKWQVYQPGSDGQRRVIAVLIEDRMQGKLYSDAYVDGTRCFMYVPQAGEELNMLIADVAGTGDVHTAGDTMIVKSGTGKLIVTTGSPQSEPFRLEEGIAAPTADVWLASMYTGY